MRLWKDLGYSSRSIGAFRGKAKAAGVMALAIAGVVAMPTLPRHRPRRLPGTGAELVELPATGAIPATGAALPPRPIRPRRSSLREQKILVLTPSPLITTSPTTLSSPALTFSSGGGAFFLGGDSFDIEANPTITQSSASNESIANAFTNNGSNTGATLNLTGTGAGVVTLSGAISNGTGLRTVAVTETGSSTYILSDGSNSFSGGVNVDGGTLEITAAGAMGTGTATINGGTLQLAGITSTKALTFDADTAA